MQGLRADDVFRRPDFQLTSDCPHRTVWMFSVSLPPLFLHYPVRACEECGILHFADMLGNRDYAKRMISVNSEPNCSVLRVKGKRNLSFGVECAV